MAQKKGNRDDVRREAIKRALTEVVAGGPRKLAKAAEFLVENDPMINFIKKVQDPNSSLYRNPKSKRRPSMKELEDSIDRENVRRSKKKYTSGSS